MDKIFKIGILILGVAFSVLLYKEVTKPEKISIEARRFQLASGTIKSNVIAPKINSASEIPMILKIDTITGQTWNLRSQRTIDNKYMVKDTRWWEEITGESHEWQMSPEMIPDIVKW